jgi:hypothetical protein
MSRSVSSVRSSDPWLRRTDKRPLAQRRGLPPSAGKIVSTFFACSGRDWRHNCIAFCIFAELLSFCHGALPPRAPPYEMSPHFEWLSGQNCSLYESSWSLRAEQCIWEKVLGASGRLRFMLRNLQQMLEPLPPAMVGFATHRTASLENTRCCLGWPLLLPQRV